MLKKILRSKHKLMFQIVHINFFEYIFQIHS